MPTNTLNVLFSGLYLSNLVHAHPVSLPDVLQHGEY